MPSFARSPPWPASAQAARVVAVLMQHREEGHVRVDEFDTGYRRANRDDTLQLQLPADRSRSSGEVSGERRYAVLSVNDDPAAAPKLAQKIEIRSTDMAYVQDIWLGRYLEVLDAVGFADSTGASRIAVLRRNADEGWLDIAIVDPASGETVQTLAFDGNIVPDISGALRRHRRESLAQVLDRGHRRGRRQAPRADTRPCLGRCSAQRVGVEGDADPGSRVPAGRRRRATPSLGLVVRDNSQDNRFRVYFVDLLTGTKSGPLLEYAF